MYLARTPAIARALFRSRLWRMPVADGEKTLYLTFDDGPVPEATPWVLDCLREHNAKATFFCVGRNIEVNPDLFRAVRNDGHTVGNHTWDHSNGRDTQTAVYLASVERCERLTRSGLFRPPYGRMTLEQARALRENHSIVMWSVLSGDFDPRTDADRCTRNVIANAAPGSIVVFHDSVKAWPRLRDTLPKVLEHFAAADFAFKALPAAELTERSP